ncbi:hypothetical protein BNCALIDO_00161 [Aeromonas phage vB_AdhM_TS9]|nr:hypothetical protein BNCALIDO_00161 [Aeromonas phage vB_AdhM_TS9]
MNKDKVYETLMNQSSSCSYYLRCVVECVEQIKHTKTKLENMVRHQETYENKSYILHHKGLWDNYTLDLDTLTELTLEFKTQFDKAVESGKYLDVNFCKIKHKDECPESDVDQFGWDEENNDIYVYEWDCYEGFHHYGELWAIVVTDKMTGNVEDTLTYKNLQKQLEHLERDLKNNIEYCKLFE